VPCRPTLSIYRCAPGCSADPDADRRKLEAFLASPLKLAPEQQDTVLFVIDSMSFSAELARQQAQQGEQQAQQEQQRQQQERILAVVQDADRLVSRPGGGPGARQGLPCCYRALVYCGACFAQDSLGECGAIASLPPLLLVCTHGTLQS